MIEREFGHCVVYRESPTPTTTTKDMTSITEQRDGNLLFLNRVVFDALNRKVMKDIFNRDFHAWYDGGESYRITFKVYSLGREEIARLKSARITVEWIEAYTNHLLQVHARVPDINKVRSNLNDGRKHVI